MKKKYIVLIMVLLVIPYVVKAHPGRTDSSRCHYCRTNCSKYGLSDGQYHCHNGENSSDNNSQPTPPTENNNSNTNNNTQTDTTTNNQPQQQIEETRSNDNTLKYIIIDNTKIEIKEEMEYETYNEIINIEVYPNDEKATYKINNNLSLIDGENNITIEVTAENGEKKTYNLRVNKKRKLSSDTKISVVIDNEEVEFTNYKAIVYVDYDVEKINFDYKLSDKNATVDIEELKDIKPGDNLINIIVTAEDGTKQEYEIIIYKDSKSNDNNILSTIITYGLFGGIGYGIYKYKKKK